MNICGNIIDDIIPHIVIHLDYFTLINYLASCKQLNDTTSNDILHAVHQVVEKLAHENLQQIILTKGSFFNTNGQYDIKITGPEETEYEVFRNLIQNDTIFSDNLYSTYKRTLESDENRINIFTERHNLNPIKYTPIPPLELVKLVKVALVMEHIPCNRDGGYDKLFEKFNRAPHTIMGVKGTFDIYQYTLEYDTYSCEWIIDSAEHLTPYNFINGMNNLAGNTTIKQYRNYLHLHRLNIIAGKMSQIIAEMGRG